MSLDSVSDSVSGTALMDPVCSDARSSICIRSNVLGVYAASEVLARGANFR
jgi:hypothetical protein